MALDLRADGKYIRGNTFPVKDKLKDVGQRHNAGLRWDPDARAWSAKSEEHARKVVETMHREHGGGAPQPARTATGRSVYRSAPVRRSPPPLKAKTFEVAPEKWGTPGHAVTSEKLKVNYGEMDDEDNFPRATMSTKVLGAEMPEGKIVDKRIINKDGQRHVEYLHEQRTPEAQFEYMRKKKLDAIDKTLANPIMTEMWGQKDFDEVRELTKTLKEAKFGDDLPKIGNGLRHPDVSSVEHLDTPGATPKAQAIDPAGTEEHKIDKDAARAAAKKEMEESLGKAGAAQAQRAKMIGAMIAIKRASEARQQPQREPLLLAEHSTIAAPKQTQAGPKGGSFYVTATGTKIYRPKDKIPAKYRTQS